MITHAARDRSPWKLVARFAGAREPGLPSTAWRTSSSDAGRGLPDQLLINVCDAVRPDGARSTRPPHGTLPDRARVLWRAAQPDGRGEPGCDTSLCQPTAARSRTLHGLVWMAALPDGALECALSVRPVWDLAGTCGLLPGTTIASKLVSL